MVDFTRNTFEASQMIFDKGDAAESVYVLRSGLVDIRLGTRGKNASTLGQVRAGEVFGEVALLENRCHRASAIAREKSVILEIPRDEFMRRLDAADPIMKSVVGHLIARLQDITSFT